MILSLNNERCNIEVNPFDCYWQNIFPIFSPVLFEDYRINVYCSHPLLPQTLVSNDRYKSKEMCVYVMYKYVYIYI